MQPPFPPLQADNVAATRLDAPDPENFAVALAREHNSDIPKLGKL